MEDDNLTTISGLVTRLSACGVVMDRTTTCDIVLSGTRPSDQMIDQVKVNKDALVSLLTLERRLVHGWTVCNAETNPARRTWLEEHWAALLQEYERACDTPLWKAVARWTSTPQHGRADQRRITAGCIRAGLAAESRYDSGARDEGVYASP
jgi:hypothetical protein